MGGACMIQRWFRLHLVMPGGVRTSPLDHAMASDHHTPLPFPAPSAIFRRLPEGGVLFSTETEVYFGVGVVGARIWELLPPATRTVEEMVAILSSQYHDVPASQIRTDVERFLTELVTNGLVAPEAKPARGDRQIP